MIITGGSLKGRRIKTIASREVRPTSSKIRESIFNIIQSMHQSFDLVLDLFAGSGIIGLEAYSRGARKVVFVEKNPKVAKILRENLGNFDFDYELIISDAIRALDKLKGNKFDFIFIDPPYASGLIEPALVKIRNNELLAADGIVIIEHSPDYDVNNLAVTLDFEILKEKKYGDTAITIINK